MYTIGNNALKILSLYLSNYKKRYYLREISALSRIPLKTTQNTLKILKEESILKSETVGKNRYFTLNMDNINTRLYLMQAEIFRTSLFIEKYPLLKPFIKDFNTLSTPVAVFGSFARFKATKASDLDILIVSGKTHSLPEHLVPPEIHKVFLSEKLFIEGIEKKEALIAEIFESHIILNSFSFFVNVMWDYYG
ncbi:MAG: nucleotidyltransferase domain-containing protein [Candidatus Aenigmarchaeota archaeon]|nr:nucleotidyltransferase domain-containing protein [Candidatus Aenigmarchaeota archaeon]